MKRTLGLALISLTVVASAQSLPEYLHMRRAYHIEKAVSPEVIQNFTGAKICELAGTVNGTFSVGSQPSIVLELRNGTTCIVEAATLPDWLKSNQVDVRLIVRAIRKEEGGQLDLQLLGAAPEDSVPADPPPPAPKPSPVVSTARIVPKSSTPARQWIVPASQATPIYAGFIKRVNPKLSDGQCMEMAEAIVGFGLKYRVDPRLIIAVVLVESDFDPMSTSRPGAMGLGQLMPGTAEWMGVRNPYDPVDNIHGCVKLIRTHMDQYLKETGNQDAARILALAAYNAGIGAVRRSGGVPPYRETQAYVRRVLGLYRQLSGE